VQPVRWRGEVERRIILCIPRESDACSSAAAQAMRRLDPTALPALM
jgi:hypothetical protein